VTARAEFLSATIGLPWAWTERNCWDFAAHVELQLFGRVLPHVSVPDDPSWRWMVSEVSTHAERDKWTEVPPGPHGLITAGDGALVLMGRLNHPGHIGVWLKPEQRIIHCDRKNGVCFEVVMALQAQGWKKLRFYEPK